MVGIVGGGGVEGVPHPLKLSIILPFPPAAEAGGSTWESEPRSLTAV